MLDHPVKRRVSMRLPPTCLISHQRKLSNFALRPGYLGSIAGAGKLVLFLPLAVLLCISPFPDS